MDYYQILLEPLTKIDSLSAFAKLGSMSFDIAKLSGNFTTVSA